jgi:hypothetical protein
MVFLQMVFLPIPAELQSALDALPIPRGIVAESRCYFWNGITSRRALVGIAERAMAAVFAKSKWSGHTPTDSATMPRPGLCRLRASQQLLTGLSVIIDTA